MKELPHWVRGEQAAAFKIKKAHVKELKKQNEQSRKRTITSHGGKHIRTTRDRNNEISVIGSVQKQAVRFSDYRAE